MKCKGKNHLIVDNVTGIEIQTRSFIEQIDPEPKYEDLCCIICHPHPQYGGTMQNNVVRGIRDEMLNNNIQSVTFNFRGVGRSTGSYSNGIGEQKDLLNVVDYIKTKYKDIKRIYLTAYSFGAVVALGAANRIKDLICLSMVAYPFGFLKNIKPDYSLNCPKLFIIGKNDKIGGYDSFSEQYKEFRGPKSYTELTGADHFYSGYEKKIGRICKEFLDENM